MDYHSIECKYNKKIYKFLVSNKTTFSEFKELIYQETKVKPEHQKILNFGLKTSKKIEPNSLIEEFKIKIPKHTITLIGSAEQDILETNKIIDPLIEKIEGEIEKLKIEFYKMKELNLKGEDLSDQILKYDELFLQKMIQLDKITKEELRTERKRIIVKIQMILKEVDSLKEEEKKTISKF